MTETKNGWGGKRPGAGKPKGAKSIGSGSRPLLPLSPVTQYYTVAKYMPCATRNGEGICGKPATVVRAWQVMSDRHAGCFLVQPVCKECADEAKQLYSPDRGA